MASNATLTDEEKLRIIAEVSADAIYDWDISAGLTRWNHGMRTLFGYSGATVQTHAWWQERVHPEDKERVVASVRRALEQKVDYWTEEYRFRRADRSVAHVIDRGYLIYARDRNPIRMIGAMVDITSRVALAEAQILSAGFEVIDLGVDVAPEKFVEAVAAGDVDIVALSALLTTTMPHMQTTIEAIEQAGLRDRVKVIVGGAPLTQGYAREIGADGFSADASTVPALAASLL